MPNGTFETSFMDFLKDKCCADKSGRRGPYDTFEDWLSGRWPEEIIEYAEEWAEQELKDAEERMKV